MSTTTLPKPVVRDPLRAISLLVIAILLGAISFAGVGSLVKPDRDNKCLGFAIGTSEIGGPDCIGGRSLPWERLLGPFAATL